MGGLLPFPAAAGAGPEPPALFAARGFALRAATLDDIPRLQQVYADSRDREMAGVPWPDAAKRSFLDQQFALQHQHYVAHYAGTDFLVIEHQGIVQGRYYLRRAAPEHLIVDISLVAPYRGQGLGRALIEASQAQAQAQGCGMELHVVKSNLPARRLYDRLGFVPCDGGTDTHQRMRWPAS